MAYDIFISYSRKDISVANSISNRLKEEGYSLFIDVEGLSSGDSYADKIVQAIRECKLFLYIASESSSESSWNHRELMFANNCGCTILPIMLCDYAHLNPHIRFILDRINALDLYSSNKPIYEQLQLIVNAVQHWLPKDNKESINAIP